MADGAGGELRQGSGYPLVPGPVVQVLQVEADLLPYHAKLGHVSLKGGLAQVSLEGSEQFVLPRLDLSEQVPEGLLTAGKVQSNTGAEKLPLAVHKGSEFHRATS